MSISYLDNKSFLKRVLTAMNELNTLDFESITSAFTRLIQELSYNMTEIVDVYKSHKFKTSASIISLKDKILEKNNKDFLDDLAHFIAAINTEFNNKSIKYGKLCLDCIEKNKGKKEDLAEAFYNVLEHEKDFQVSIKKVRQFSLEKLTDAQDRKITHLEKYSLLFKQLTWLSELTWKTAKTRLTSEKPIL